jgi:hypothetical protein
LIKIASLEATVITLKGDDPLIERRSHGQGSD